jgi:hypothetical protein
MAVEQLFLQQLRRLEIFVYNGERRGVGTIKMHDLLTGKVQVNDPNTAAKA